MKTRILFSLVLIAAVFVAGCGQSGTEEATASTQTTCPVMGGKIDKTIYVDHDGERVYFCCDACVETFKKEPAKYIKKLKDQGVALEKAPGRQVERL